MSTPAKSYKPKRHIVVDIETLSTKRNAVVIDIAAVAVDWNRPTSNQFQIYLRDKEQSESGLFDIDSSTIAFHLKNDPNFIDDCNNNGVIFQEAVQSFADWIQMQSSDVELHMWSQGKDFDYPILENLFNAAGVKIPWNYGRIHCLRDLVWLNPAARLKSEGPTAHKALPDALQEARQLIAVVNNSSWYQRLFK